jgi:hypothetical protein
MRRSRRRSQREQQRDNRGNRGKQRPSHHAVLPEGLETTVVCPSAVVIQTGQTALTDPSIQATRENLVAYAVSTQFRTARRRTSASPSLVSRRVLPNGQWRAAAWLRRDNLWFSPPRLGRFVFRWSPFTVLLFPEPGPRAVASTTSWRTGCTRLSVPGRSPCCGQDGVTRDWATLYRRGFASDP